MASFDVDQPVSFGTADSAGGTASEHIVKNKNRDGVLTFNKSKTTNLYAAFIPALDTGTKNSAYAYGQRMVCIPPETMIYLGCKGATRLLFSTETGTADWNCQDGDS